MWKPLLFLFIQVFYLLVSEGLNSVETASLFRTLNNKIVVSEGLNSVETAVPFSDAVTPRDRFQKDLIVWKPSG